jgi:cytochrome bd-type quinol oxidase subunit 1
MTEPTLDVMYVPLVANSVAVGVVSLLHIAFASLAVGFMILAPIAEAFGASRPFYTDMAHTLTRVTVVTYTTSLVLAVIMIELFIGLFPLTNAWLFNRFRFPVFLAIAAFFLQLLLLYPYYHYWEAIRAKAPRLHIGLGGGAAALMLVWVSVLDGIGSYMLTPTESNGRWSVLFNPTWLPLVVHRFFGNLVFAGYTIAGYGAWRLGRPHDPLNEAYYRHVLKTGLLIGLGALLLQPVTGWIYASAIQGASPQSYAQVVRGPYQALVYVQFSLIAVLLIGSHVLLRTAAGDRSTHVWVDRALIVAAALMVGSVGHPDVRRACTFAAVGLSCSSLLRWRTRLTKPDAAGWHRPLVRGLSLGLAVVALLTYLTMGTIRETARRPYTVQGIISLHEEAEAPAALTEERRDAAR